MTASSPHTTAMVPPARRPSRAGRDLVAAITVGVGLGIVILLSLLVQRQYFIGVLALATAAGTWELAGALRRGAGIAVPLPVLLAGGQAMVWLSWPFGLRGLGVAFAVTALAVLLWRMRAGSEHYLRDVAAGLFTAAYVPFLAGFAILMDAPHDGAARVATYVIVIVCSDVGGYAAGVLFGRHPMAPRISPKKSWEGMAGSLLACATGGGVSVATMLDGDWWQGALLGLALAVAATLGDLGESLLKRDIGVKDMGTLLPGHGGIMDRLDSLLPSAALAYLLLSIVAPA